MTRRTNAVVRRSLVALVAPIALVTATLAPPRTARALPNGNVWVTTMRAPSAAIDGVFRVEFRDGTRFVTPAMFVIDHLGDQASVLVILNERITPLVEVHGDGSVVTGSMDTAMGVGTVRLEIDGSAVRGTVTVGRKTLTISGTRTV